jgi:hypothetical protein
LDVKEKYAKYGEKKQRYMTFKVSFSTKGVKRNSGV